MSDEQAFAFKLSRGLSSTASPPIPLAYQWGMQYDGTHGPKLDMSQGVPGDPPQPRLQSALATASSSVSSFGYGTAGGNAALRNAMAAQMRGIYGAGEQGLTADHLSMVAGCNMAFVAVIMALADAGDQVILPTPWYFNHQMTLSMLNITPVPLKTRPERGFAPSVEDCEKLITGKTRAIVLVTPNNPTGAIYPPALISSFYALAQKHDLALVLDETYRDFLLPTTPPHNLFAQPDWGRNLIHIYSFSKSYCIPGHRLGLVAASPAFHMTGLHTILDSLQICAPVPPQLALGPILADLRPGVLAMAESLARRRQVFVDNLPEGWTVGSIGGYFAFVRHPFEGMGSVEVCRRLATEIGVVLLPGAFFQDLDAEEDRWIRFSVANCGEEGIIAVCERLALARQLL
ncbi:unnamed protein product [Mycena citricolor]|uniref:Aminotransferase class I/classII large domain-containing protein n=1 Tax=Mycena citricolor TaxID=2018698 RepID=A0AAD2HWB2_9AGAR|nr:unnamed protein product [Mycena citricolor]